MKKKDVFPVVLGAVLLVILVYLILAVFIGQAGACYGPDLCPPPHGRYIMYLPLIMAGSLPPWMK